MKLKLAILIALYIPLSVYSQENIGSWKTLTVTKGIPLNIEKSVLDDFRSKMELTFAELPNTNIENSSVIPSEMQISDEKAILEYGRKNGYERIIIAEIKEIQKEKNETGTSGESKYLVKKTPGKYETKVSLYCMDSDKRYSVSDNFTGQLFQQKSNIYLNEFQAAYELKPLPVVQKNYFKIKRIQLSISSESIIPAGSYRDYSNFGSGLGIKGGVIPVLIPDVLFSINTAFFKMNEKHNKIKPYQRYDFSANIGYIFSNIIGKIDIIPQIGAGVTVHRIENKTVSDPLYLFGTDIKLNINSSSSLFAGTGLTSFYDSDNKGFSIKISLGYMHIISIND
jgi:hypothetical protein